MPEVRDFEPHTALFSPHNGTAHLKAVADLAAHALKPGGMFFVEHGAQQGQKIRGLLTDSGFFHGVKTLRDLAGLERCTYAARR
jgi:release factor glutamine methyltransferase